MSADREPAATEPGSVAVSVNARQPVVAIFRTSLRLLTVGSVGVSALGLLSRDLKAAIGAALVALASPALLWTLHRGHARFAMNGAVSMIWLLACVEIALGDGVRDTGMGLFTLVILVSALLLDRKSAVCFSALSVLSALGIGVAGSQGWLRSPLAAAVAPGDLAILVFMLAMLAVLMHAVTRAFFRGVDEAAHHEQMYGEIFKATTDAIFICDPQTLHIQDVNRAGCALFGLSRAQLLCGAATASGEQASQAEAAALLRTQLRVALADGLSVFEWRFRHGDGRELCIEGALHTAQIRGRDRVLATLRDISERKASAERARAAEGLKALGQLAGGVAHDFNNQLTGIIASATLLKAKLRGDVEAQHSLDLALRCCQRSADLTRQLLAFARKGRRHEEVVSVDSLLREVVTLLEHSIDKRVTIDLQLADDARARVLCDASFLGSALLNLGLNARDAMPEGGLLRFQAQWQQSRDVNEARRTQLSASDAGYVSVLVSDTGVGIPVDALSHVFEPFFTTKPDGNGLGLSAAYGTVQAHGGAIFVDSALGAGTTIEVLLPATAQPLSQAEAPAATQALPPLRVLLAEDEHEVGRSTELILQALGCAVTWRRDGWTALNTFERNPDAFDVIILDHSMPRMLGSDVGDRISALRPELPIIATSGFADENAAKRVSSPRVFLPKPFGVEQLAAALAQVAAATASASPTQPRYPALTPAGRV